MAREEFHALVPNAERSAFLVDVDQRLPSVAVDTETSVVAAAVDGFREQHGLDAVFLRIAGWPGEPVRMLEFDSPRTRPRGSWTDLSGLREVVPDELCNHASRWADEQRGAPIPAQRPAWARPGWHAEAMRWIRETAGDVDAIDLFRQWPLSAVFVAGTSAGERLYFKSCFALFAHEAAVTHAMARRHPDLAPAVVGVDVERGWLLMRELTCAAEGVDEPRRALSALAGVHRAWAGRANEARALGAPDRGLATLYGEIEATVDALGGPPEVAADLRRRVKELDGLVPETLVHGDFHPWNVSVEGDRLVIFDWSDACVSHPLFDLPTLVHDRAGFDVDAVVDAYSSARNDLDADVVRHAFAIAYPLACVHHAISYRRIEAALEPADRGLFAPVPGQFFGRALELL